ncbi:MAG: TrbI/VirB10 family protein [Akkermansiaceae bacterium]|nr:TrbI/VirB10 family protein [Akkermansiaceae bacterium]
MPKGTKVSGKVQSTKNERIFFDTTWSLANSVGKPVAISGFARQKSSNTSDGRLGLPGFLENQPQSETTGKAIVGSLIKGAAEFGRDTVRTSIGEFVPGTRRNAIINGSSNVIDQLLTKPRDTSIKNEPYVHVPAGTDFYLVVSSQENPRQSEVEEQSNLDNLLEQMMKKRLER